jgi:hypothetical protein
MGWAPVSTASKRAIVDMAYEECSLAGYEFDRTPEEFFTGLRRLDALMREFEPNVPLGYNYPDSFGQGSLDDPAGIPDEAIGAVVKLLAVDIMPTMGKTASAETRFRGMQALVAMRKNVVVPTVRYPNTTARGAGGRWLSTWQPFFQGQPRTPTAQVLTLDDYTATAGVAWQAKIVGTLDDSLLTLCDNVQGRYSLSSVTQGGTLGVMVTTWYLNRNSPAGAGTTERPVVTEWNDGALGVPKSTPFKVVVA